MTDKDRERLIIHIKGLEAILTERNEKIERLENQLLDVRTSDEIKRAEKAAYRRGWQACASAMMETTRKMALELREIRSEAWGLFLEGEDNGVASRLEHASDCNRTIGCTCGTRTIDNPQEEQE